MRAYLYIRHIQIVFFRWVSIVIKNRPRAHFYGLNKRSACEPQLQRTFCRMFEYTKKQPISPIFIMANRFKQIFSIENHLILILTMKCKKYKINTILGRFLFQIERATINNFMMWLFFKTLSIFIKFMVIIQNDNFFVALRF